METKGRCAAMIAFDFSYYRPETLKEAIEIYKQIALTGKLPVYYGGGTEIISMARAGSINFDAVIDIKNIPECNMLCIENNRLIIGSAVTLTKIAESGCFPLLGKTVSRIADHTIQDKITIGGNIAGSIIYREAALPLMIANSKVKITRKNKLHEISFSEVFDGHLHLQEGEFIVQFSIDINYLNLPYCHVKKTKQDKIDYPLLTLAAIKTDNGINAAVSGLSDKPFLLPVKILNEPDVPETIRADKTIAAIQNSIISDLIIAGKEYRMFVLKNVLMQMFENFREEKYASI